MDLNRMRQLAKAQEFSEDCGCDEPVVESRADMENAIWKAFPAGNKAMVAGQRKLMFTGPVAKAAGVDAYTNLKMSDLTDHQIKSVLAQIQKKRENVEENPLAAFAEHLSAEQLALLDGFDDSEMRVALDQLAENLLLSEETPTLVRHCVRSVAKKYEGDTAKAFAICTAQLQKSGYLKPNSTTLTAAGKKKEAQHASDPDAAKKTAEYEKLLKANRKSESLSDRMKSLLDEGKCVRCGGRVGVQNPGNVCSTCKTRAKTAEALGEAKTSFFVFKGPQVLRKQAFDDVEDAIKLALKTPGAQVVKRTYVRGDQEDEVVWPERKTEAAKTYAAAQADIMTGLEKDGWKVSKMGPSGTLKVPYATSKDGVTRLYFKAQAIYMSHDTNAYGAKHDFKKARSLHLGDIRTGDYSTFGRQLARWTGELPNGEKPQKAAPKPAAAPAAAKDEPKSEPKAAAAPAAGPMSPDQYRAKHGQCPDGYHYDDSSKRCMKSKSEAAQKPCPECKGEMTYNEERDDWNCDGCGKIRTMKAPKESVEVLRMAGVNRYPDRKLVETKKSTFAGLPREFAGLDGKHADWRLPKP